MKKEFHFAIIANQLEQHAKALRSEHAIEREYGIIKSAGECLIKLFELGGATELTQNADFKKAVRFHTSDKPIDGATRYLPHPYNLFIEVAGYSRISFSGGVLNTALRPGIIGKLLPYLPTHDRKAKSHGAAKRESYAIICELLAMLARDKGVVEDTEIESAVTQALVACETTDAKILHKWINEKVGKITRRKIESSAARQSQAKVRQGKKVVPIIENVDADNRTQDVLDRMIGEESENLGVRKTISKKAKKT